MRCPGDNEDCFPACRGNTKRLYARGLRQRFWLRRSHHAHCFKQLSLYAQIACDTSIPLLLNDCVVNGGTFISENKIVGATEIDGVDYARFTISLTIQSATMMHRAIILTARRR